MDDFRYRPGDEHVEPLFAGLGVSEKRSETVPSARKGKIAWLVALTTGSVFVAWLLG